MSQIILAVFPPARRSVEAALKRWKVDYRLASEAAGRIKGIDNLSPGDLVIAHSHVTLPPTEATVIRVSSGSELARVASPELLARGDRQPKGVVVIPGVNRDASPELVPATAALPTGGAPEAPADAAPADAAPAALTAGDYPALAALVGGVPSPHARKAIRALYLDTVAAAARGAGYGWREEDAAAFSRWSVDRAHVVDADATRRRSELLLPLRVGRLDTIRDFEGVVSPIIGGCPEAKDPMAPRMKLVRRLGRALAAAKIPVQWAGAQHILNHIGGPVSGMAVSTLVKGSQAPPAPTEPAKPAKAPATVESSPVASAPVVAEPAPKPTPKPKALRKPAAPDRRVTQEGARVLLRAHVPCTAANVGLLEHVARLSAREPSTPLPPPDVDALLATAPTTQAKPVESLWSSPLGPPLPAPPPVAPPVAPAPPAAPSAPSVPPAAPPVDVPPDVQAALALVAGWLRFASRPRVTISSDGAVRLSAPQPLVLKITVE